MRLKRGEPPHVFEVVLEIGELRARHNPMVEGDDPPAAASQANEKGKGKGKSENGQVGGVGSRD